MCCNCARRRRLDGVLNLAVAYDEEVVFTRISFHENKSRQLCRSVVFLAGELELFETHRLDLSVSTEAEYSVESVVVRRPEAVYATS